MTNKLTAANAATSARTTIAVSLCSAQSAVRLKSSKRVSTTSAGNVVNATVRSMVCQPGCFCECANSYVIMLRNALRSTIEYDSYLLIVAATRSRTIGHVNGTNSHDRHLGWVFLECLLDVRFYVRFLCASSVWSLSVSGCRAIAVAFDFVWLRSSTSSHIYGLWFGRLLWSATATPQVTISSLGRFAVKLHVTRLGITHTRMAATIRCGGRNSANNEEPVWTFGWIARFTNACFGAMERRVTRSVGWRKKNRNNVVIINRSWHSRIYWDQKWYAPTDEGLNCAIFIVWWCDCGAISFW